jgi:hypothetical protein
MDKIDLKKQYKALYTAKEGPSVIEVPELNYIMIDGQGDPNTSEEFMEAMGAIYGAAYTLKFSSKKEKGLDWTVMGLEGLWWADEMRDFTELNKANWKWTMMIMQPEFVTARDLLDAKKHLEEKKGNPAIAKLRLERYNEGLSAQIMHIGPYSTEGPNIRRLHEFIASQGGSLSGKHHEIYLSDSRKVPEDRWRTIIRQPFSRI